MQSFDTMFDTRPSGPVCSPSSRTARWTVAGHLLVSYDVGLSLRSDRTVLENTILTTVLVVLTTVLTPVTYTSEVEHCEVCNSTWTEKRGGKGLGKVSCDSSCQWVPESTFYHVRRTWAAILVVRTWAAILVILAFQAKFGVPLNTRVSPAREQR